MGVVGGLALMLYGLERLAAALGDVAGDRARRLFARLAGSPVRAFAVGALATAALQSSSVVTVLLVGFVTAELVTLRQAIGVIVGANVGATLTVQVLAFDVTHWGLPLLALGISLRLVGRDGRWRRVGEALLGIGLVLFGMGLMEATLEPLRSSPALPGLLAALSRPVTGLLAGFVVTAIVHSSAATIGATLVLAGQGVLPLEGAIAIVMGANVGTCMTALVASLGQPARARQAALAHLLFNLFGVALWWPLRGVLAAAVTWLDPAAAASVASPRRIAHAHTLFNLATAVPAMLLAGRFATLVQRLAPAAAVAPAQRPRYLDPTLLGSPTLALDRTRLEILRMGDAVVEMLREALTAVVEGDRDRLGDLAQRDDLVDALHGEIVTYLGTISQRRLEADQTEELMRLFEAVNDLESIGDVIETNLVQLGRQRLDEGIVVSDLTRALLQRLHAQVIDAVETAVLAVTQRNERAARRVVEMKPAISRLIEEAARHQTRRLTAPEPGRLPAYALETDIVANLHRIYYFACRMARAAVPELLRTQVH